MGYKINKTDGSLLVDLVDTTVDSETTNLTLVGKGYAGYGEIFNENLIKLLENFSSVTAPTTPITGQLWYDSSESRLKVYSGTLWKSTDTVSVSSTQPPMVSGDIWIDSENEQLYFTQGTDILLAGPIYTRTQQISGFDVKDITDTSGIKHTIVRQFISGTLMAVHAKSIIAYDATNSTNLSILPGYTSPINVGINVSPSQSGFIFNGTATTSKNIVSAGGDSYTPEQLLKTASDNTTTGTLHIKNDAGITIGHDSDYIIIVDGNRIVNRCNKDSSDWRLQIKQGATDKTVIDVKNSTTRIGLWNEAPQYSLDLTGDLRVTGNLIVEGTSTSVDVDNLRVEDKLIELGITSDSTLLTEAQADNSGISVRVSGDDKTLTWTTASNAWNSSCGFNVPTGFTYKINNVAVVTGPTITLASLKTEVAASADFAAFKTRIAAL